VIFYPVARDVWRISQKKRSTNFWFRLCVSLFIEVNKPCEC
jgi:hypothetical protein